MSRTRPHSRIVNWHNDLMPLPQPIRDKPLSDLSFSFVFPTQETGCVNLLCIVTSTCLTDCEQPTVISYALGLTAFHNRTSIKCWVPLASFKVDSEPSLILATWNVFHFDSELIDTQVITFKAFIGALSRLWGKCTCDSRNAEKNDKETSLTIPGVMQLHYIPMTAFS